MFSLQNSNVTLIEKILRPRTLWPCCHSARQAHCEGLGKERDNAGMALSDGLYCAAPVAAVHWQDTRSFQAPAATELHTVPYDGRHLYQLHRSAGTGANAPRNSCTTQREPRWQSAQLVILRRPHAIVNAG